MSLLECVPSSRQEAVNWLSTEGTAMLIEVLVNAVQTRVSSFR